MFLIDVYPATCVYHGTVAQIVNVNNIDVKGLQPSCDIHFATNPIPALVLSAGFIWRHRGTLYKWR
jgi:hypothetical protein